MKKNIKTSHCPYNTLCHPRVFLSGISTLLKKWPRLPITTLGNDSTARAFTLIELLVVVLIIGVLTAIALPKYQVAVQKSRYATLMPLAKSVKNAEEAMLMSRGSYSSKLADLDINLSGTADGDSKVTSSEGNSFTINADDNQSYVRALTKDNKNAYVMYFDKSSRYPKEIHCEAQTDNKIAMQVCQSYGATQTVTGTTSGYTAYVLEGSGTDAGAINIGGNDYNWDCYYDEERAGTACDFVTSSGFVYTLSCGGDMSQSEGTVHCGNDSYTVIADHITAIPVGFETPQTFFGVYEFRGNGQIIQYGYELSGGGIAEYYHLCKTINGNECSEWYDWDL